MGDDDLAELRAAAAEATVVGVCHVHPEREASFTCRRCGDHQCEDCNRAMHDGLCPACVRASDGKLAPSGGMIVFSFSAVWLAAQLWGVWQLSQSQAHQSGLWGALVTLVLSGALLVAMLQGSSAAHHAWVTWLGLAGVLNAFAGNLVLAIPSLVFAGLLLSPAVSAYVATCGRRPP
jgi:hypothetical protein